MSFPDYDALVVESQQGVPGGEVRLSLMRRGAELERDRIIALLEAQNADYHRLGYPAKYGAIAHAITLINGELA